MKKGLLALLIVLSLPCASAATLSNSLAQAILTSGAIIILNDGFTATHSADINATLLSDDAGVVSAIPDEEFQQKLSLGIIHAISGVVKPAGLQRLADSPAVKELRPIRKTRIALSNSAPRMNATRAWNLTYNGSTLTGLYQTVCIIDTGIDYTHPDLGGCTNTSFLAGNCSKIPAGYNYVMGTYDPMDDHGHGTHVAGIVASENSTYRGIAPLAKLIALKTCNSAGSCDDANVIAAISWCVDNSSRFNISVISLSLGAGLSETYCDDDPLSAAVNYAANFGLFVAVASANDYSATSIGYPACASNATSVGATDNDDSVAVFSNTAPILDLLAPGVSIISTVPRIGSCTHCSSSGFKAVSGTSMATPHVSGAAALLREYKRLESNTTLTPKQIENVFKAAGANVTRGAATFPRIDIYRAILSLDTTPPVLNYSSAIQNGTSTNDTSALINVSGTELLANCTLQYAGQNTSMNMAGTSCYINATLVRGVRQFMVQAGDPAGNLAATQIRTVAFNNSAPQPLLAGWASILGESNVSINYSCTELDNDSISYLLFVDGALNSTLSGNTTIGLGDGSHTLTVQASDGFLAGNSTANVTVDTTPPLIGIGSNTLPNSSYTQNNWIFFNITLVEEHLSLINYSLYNSSGRLFSNITNATSINWTGLSEGNYTYMAWALDSTGRSSQTQNRTVTVQYLPAQVYMVQILFATNQSAVIMWSTDLVSNATIHYGPNQSYTDQESNTSFLSSHQQLISGLQPGTEYHFLITTATNSGKFMNTSDYRLETSRTQAAEISAAVNQTVTFNVSGSVAVMQGVASFSATMNISTGTFTQSNLSLNRSIKYISVESSNLSNSTLRLVYYYNVTDLVSRNISEESLSIYWLNGSWMQLSTSMDFVLATGVNTEEDYVYANLTHFSSYAVAGLTANNYPCINDDDCYSVICAHNFCRASNPYCGDGYCDAAESCSADASACQAGYSCSNGCQAPAASPSSGGGGGGGGGAAAPSNRLTYVFDNLPTAGEYYGRIITQRFALTGIRFAPSAGTARLILADVNASVLAPLEHAYQYLNISSDLSSVRLEFAVNKSWIAAENVTPQQIRLAHYADGWQMLNTILINQTDTRTMHSADVPSFSVFGITYARAPVEMPVQQPVKNQSAEQPSPPSNEQPRAVPGNNESAESPSPVKHSNRLALILFLLVIVAAIIATILYKRPTA